MTVGELLRLIADEKIPSDAEVNVRVVLKPHTVRGKTLDELEIVDDAVIQTFSVEVEDVLDATHPGALVLFVGPDEFLYEGEQ